jgi:hypothetical protein
VADPLRLVTPGLLRLVPQHRQNGAAIAPEGQAGRRDPHHAPAAIGQDLGLAVFDASLGEQLLPQIGPAPPLREEVLESTNGV